MQSLILFDRMFYINCYRILVYNAVCSKINTLLTNRISVIDIIFTEDSFLSIFSRYILSLRVRYVIILTFYIGLHEFSLHNQFFNERKVKLQVITHKIALISSCIVIKRSSALDVKTVTYFKLTWSTQSIHLVLEARGYHGYFH